ncbi:rCG48910 [Rattus norvegicus]|uniref:RCG48910 n=1 Tax=Rattus norvegicus TaxID=10116 RepID=A6IG99_RAT|nr:rCG48910 [Rattus norvegicus]
MKIWMGWEEGRNGERIKQLSSRAPRSGPGGHAISCLMFQLLCLSTIMDSVLLSYDPKYILPPLSCFLHESYNYDEKCGQYNVYIS